MMPSQFKTLPILAILGSAEAALACGGFFCSTAPVDQNAERVLFEVNPDETITAHVEIAYTGEAENFSWVVPVPNEPSLDVLPQEALRWLARATQPQFIAPPTTCNVNRGFGIFDDAQAESAGGVPNAPSVDVTVLERVGPFDPLFVQSDDAGALIDWLNTNNFLITREMEPFVESYVEGGMGFLAMKLAADADTQDIQPISMTFAATQPMLPLVLTAVAAEPEMAVIMMIAGDTRYVSENLQNITVDTDLVQMNPAFGQNNYWDLVSLLIDDAGGEAVVTEFAGPSSTVDFTSNQSFNIPEDEQNEAQVFLDALVQRHSYITRLYTRISAWEMKSDPMFTSSDAGDHSNVHDLSDRPAIEVCGDSRGEASPCGETYCGDGSFCGTTEIGDGCLCPAGTLARGITDASGRGRSKVTCARADFDLMESVSSQQQGLSLNDACTNFDCGEGSCEVLNGFPTCHCNEGNAAVGLGGNRLTCVKAERSFSSNALTNYSGQGCNCDSGGDPSSLAMMALLLGGWMFRRRRR